MPGKYGSASVTVSFDDGPGGTLRAITNHILTLGGVKVTSAMQLSHAFGDSAEESTPSGITKVDPITLGGFWDTTATTGPHAVLGTPDTDPNGSTRTLQIVFGDGKTFTVETRLVSYAVMAKNGALTEFEAVIQPTGAHAWS